MEAQAEPVDVIGAPAARISARAKVQAPGSNLYAVGE